VTITSTKTPTIVHYKNVKVKIKKPECLSKAKLYKYKICAFIIYLIKSQFKKRNWTCTLQIFKKVGIDVP